MGCDGASDIVGQGLDLDVAHLGRSVPGQISSSVRITYAIDGLFGRSMFEYNLELGEVSSEFTQVG